jgi:hypothetical protein
MTLASLGHDPLDWAQCPGRSRFRRKTASHFSGQCSAANPRVHKATRLVDESSTVERSAVGHELPSAALVC